MNRSLARRYAPLAAIAVVQLLIIAVAPSKAPDTVSALGGVPHIEGEDGPTGIGAGAVGPGTADLDGDSVVDPGTVDLDGDGVADPAPAPGAGGGADGDGGGGTDGGGGGGDGDDGGPPAGDTSHCVGGRQFDPAIDFYAPPCTPKFQGNNGGATYPGVTGETINIVNYVGQGNAAVDAILRAQRAYVEPEQREAYNQTVANFINNTYELYGRKVVIKQFQGTCRTIPPDNACLRDEMRRVKTDLDPYFFFWNASLSSQTYDELSRLGVPNAGGWHFRDSFNAARRPFRWDVQMSGTAVAKHFGQLWCQQLKDHPTEFAGAGQPSDMNGQPRRLGVISTDDPENQKTVLVDLKEELAKCGTGFVATYFYKQDISTAQQQREAGVAAMRQGGATAVVCFCDLVAPTFLYLQEQQDNYYPENLVTGTGFMDADQASQAYDRGAACSANFGGSRPCAFLGAYGLSSINAQEPENKDAGSRVWSAGGGQGNPPFNAVQAQWDYINMIATLIQSAGPNLNPATMEAGAFKLGVRGGGDTNMMARGFGPGDHTWNSDMRVVYWSNKTISPRNGVNGTYIQIQGKRVMLGQYPKAKLSLPPMPR
ncbi:MAG: hypothetical protein WD232_04665 [Acidimicrobiales bacterium]